MTELRKERMESKWEKRDGVLSAFRSTSFRAVNFVPFHGRQPGPVKTAVEKDRPPGGVGGIWRTSCPSHTHAHPCSFFPINNFSPSTLSFLSHTLQRTRSHTHVLPSLSSHSASLITFTPFALFFLYLTDILPMRDIPPASLSPKAPTNPREPCCRTLRVVA